MERTTYTVGRDEDGNTIIIKQVEKLPLFEQVADLTQTHGQYEATIEQPQKSKTEASS